MVPECLLIVFKINPTFYPILKHVRLLSPYLQTDCHKTSTSWERNVFVGTKVHRNTVPSSKVTLLWNYTKKKCWKWRTSELNWTHLKASPVGQVVSDTVGFWPVNEWNCQNDEEVGYSHKHEEHGVEMAVRGHQFLELYSGREPQDDEHREVETHGVDHQGRERAVHPHSCAAERKLITEWRRAVSPDRSSANIFWKCCIRHLYLEFVICKQKLTISSSTFCSTCFVFCFHMPVFK